jgi:RNA polymerase sigma factor (sigma-70 family)
LSALHARFSAPLHRFFRSYRLNAADAEDFTQDVFLRLAGAPSRMTLREPEAFVFTLARNLVRDRARRLHIKAIAKSISVDDIDISCQRPAPEDRVEIAQRLQHVERVLASLKPHTRLAFVLHRIHGDSHAEIAARMDISVSMVEKHIMAAMISLRSMSTQ